MTVPLQAAFKSLSVERPVDGGAAEVRGRVMSAATFVDHYNHRRYHESLDDLTPADVYFGRGQNILDMRKEIKHKTIEQRRRNHFKLAA